MVILNIQNPDKFVDEFVYIKQNCNKKPAVICLNIDKTNLQYGA